MQKPAETMPNIAGTCNEIWHRLYKMFTGLYRKKSEGIGYK